MKFLPPPLLVLFAVAGCRYAPPHGDSGPVVDSPPYESGDSDTDADTDTDDTSTPARRPMNVVFILTDDQRWDSVWTMPLTTERLGDAGATFENAYVNTPMCCPARASILAGGFYSSQTGVRSNGSPNGGVGRFYDEYSIGVRLQEAGYRTGLVGKYLNEYPDIETEDPGAWPYVPPGWDAFEASLTETDWDRYSWVSGTSGSEPTIGVETTVEAYITDRVTERSAAFIEADDGRPFFLIVSHSAPHLPMVPDPADDGVYEGSTIRAPSYQEEDVGDKPAHVQAEELASAATRDLNDDRYANALETLPAVDRSNIALLDLLESTGHADDTLVIFGSDNGFLWGEHRFYSKGLPYEESVRVPLLVYWPGLGGGQRAELASVTADVPATIYDAALVEAPITQGRSLRPLLEGDSSGWPESLYIEAESEGGAYPTWAGLVTHDWKYVEYASGELELYDLVNDPYELESQHLDPVQASRINSFSAELAPVKGMAIAPIELSFAVGQRVDEALPLVGGEGPFTWSLAEGSLPAGLSLSTDGRINGMPTTSGRASATFKVVGTSVSPYTGQPHDDLQVGVISVDATAALSFVAPPVVTTSPGRALLRFGLSEEVTVEVQVGPSPDFDDNPRRAAARRVGPGRYEVELAGLEAGGHYYYRVRAAGRYLGRTGDFVAR